MAVPHYTSLLFDLLTLLLSAPLAQGLTFWSLGHSSFQKLLCLCPGTHSMLLSHQPQGCFYKLQRILSHFSLSSFHGPYIFRIMGKFPLSMYNCFWDYMICPCPPLGQLHFSALVSLSSLHWPPAQCSTGSWLLFLLWFFTCFSLTWNSPSPGGFLFFHAQFKFYLHRLNFMSCLPAPFHLCP